MNKLHKQDTYYIDKLKEFIKYSKQHINDNNYYQYLGIKTQREFDREGITRDVGLKRCLNTIKKANHFIYLKRTKYYIPGTNIPVPNELSYAFLIPIDSGRIHKYMMFIANSSKNNNQKFFVSWHINDKPLNSYKNHWIVKEI